MATEGEPLIQSVAAARSGSPSSPRSKRRRLLPLSSKRARAGSYLARYLPISHWLPAYEWKKLYRDVIAGLTVGIMVVPQSMSYATVAGLSPVYGLYSALVAFLPYILFGTSRHLITGPTAVMSIMVRGAVPDVWQGKAVEVGGPVYTQLTFMLSFTACLMQLFMGFLNGGFLVDLISSPVIVGFTTGAAFLIASTQFSNMLGVPGCHTASGHSCHFHQAVWNVVTHIKSVNGATALLGGACVLILCLLKYVLKPRLKRARFVGDLGPLATVVLGLSVMAAVIHAYGINASTNRDSHYGLKVVGHIPTGLPGAEWPLAGVDFHSFTTLLPPAIGIALVGYMESITIGKTVARMKGGYELQPSQELIALGMCMLGCSLFHGYPVTGSFSRTAVNADTGAISQLAPLFASTVVGIVLLFLAPLLETLPDVVLASIVIVAIVKLIDFREALFLWRSHRRDCAVFYLVFLATLFAGVQVGLVAGILTNWALMLMSPEKPVVHVGLGGLPSLHAAPVPAAGDAVPLVDLLACSAEQFKAARMAVAVVRPTSNLNFSAAERVKSVVRQVTVAYQPTHVVLQCSAVHTVDSTGVHALTDLAAELAAQKVMFILADCSEELLDTLNRARLAKQSLKESWDMAAVGRGSGPVAPAGTQPTLTALLDVAQALRLAPLTPLRFTREPMGAALDLEPQDYTLQPLY